MCSRGKSPASLALLLAPYEDMILKATKLLEIQAERGLLF